MKEQLAELLNAHADDFEARSKIWHQQGLLTAARNLRKRATAKQKAFAHKQRQKQRKKERRTPVGLCNQSPLSFHY